MTSTPSSTRPKRSDQDRFSISPYSISLYLRTHDAFTDVHNEEVSASALPSHHLPTLASNLKRSMWSKPTQGSKQKAKQKRDRVIQKVSVGLGSSKDKEDVKPSPSQMLTKKARSVLPLLTFQNPWESYRAPGLWDMVNGGLQWGLPQDYFEGGGKGKYRGGGKHFIENIEREMKEAEKDGLRKGWEKVEIRTPDWGQSHGNDDSQAQNQDEQDHFAKATWLGHATTLLSLPSISPDDQPLKDITAEEKEAGEGKDAETGGKGRKETVEHEREVEDVRNRSLNILFDPIFSERCSPSQVAGPIRFTPTPCQVEDLPPIDVVLISHNHYDHLDFDTMTKLRERRGPALKVFVPLGNRYWFLDAGFEKDQVIEMDWWDEAVLHILGRSRTSSLSDSATPEVEISKSNTQASEEKKDSAEEKDDKIGSGYMEKGKRVRIICTPAQHGSGRGGGDKMVSLWSSWMVEHITPLPADQIKSSGDPDFTATETFFPEQDRAAIESLEKESPELFQRNTEKRFRAFFAGDTGLRYHNTNIKKKGDFPVCPAFEEITNRFGPPSLLFLPISVGSSLSYFRSWDPFPRRFSPFPRVSATLTSSIHMDAEDAVEVSGIMRGKGLSRDSAEKNGQTCLAVHYGTFIRNEAQTADDLRSLRRACLRSGMHFIRSEAGQIPSSTSNNDSKSKSDDRPSTRGSDSAFGVGAGSNNVEREPSPSSGWNKTKHENRQKVKAMENEKGKKGRFVVSDQGETVWIKM